MVTIFCHHTATGEAPVLRELRLALRALRRSPAYAVGVGLTIALVVAAAATVFGVVDRVLLRPLPFAASEELHTLMLADSTGGQALPSYPTFKDWRAAASRWEGLAFARGTGALIRHGDARRRTTVAWVSEGYFDVLGVRPLLGRFFTPDEERASGGGVLLISEGLWRSHFGGDPAVIGQTVTLDSGVVTIIGVVPQSLRYPEWADSWIPIEPLVATTPALSNRALHVDARATGRLRAGVSPEDGRRDLAQLQQRLFREYPDPSGRWTSVSTQSLHEEVVGNARGSLYALAGAVALLLLIACTNLSNLALLRMLSRAREIAVRVALGAGRRRMARHLLAESVALSLVAGAAGIGLATWATAAVRAWAPNGLPRINELSIDARIVAAAAVLSLLTGLAIGLLPVVRAGRIGFERLREGRGPGGGARVRAALSVAQIALAFVLVTGVAVLLQSFRRLQLTELGYRPAGVAAFDVNPSAARYPTEASAAALYRQLIERIRAVPGVQAVGFANHVPFRAYLPTRVEVPGRAPDPAGDAALYRTASEDYDRAVGLSVRHGRWFTEADMSATSTAMVLSESFARRLWPGEDAVGRTLTVFRSSQDRPRFGEPEPGHVVGVVADVRSFGPGVDPQPEVFLPYTREVWPWGTLVVRTAGDPAALGETLTRVVREVDPELVATGNPRTSGFRPLDEDLARWYEPRRVGTAIVIVFGVAALLLSAVGVYTATAFGVAERTGEMGVRLALGATPQRLVQMLLSQGAKLALVGLLLGAAASALVGRAIASFLYRTSPWEPLAFATAGLLLGGTAIAATFLPARRASRLDPTRAIRAD
jgi:predicted permease